MIDVAWLRNEAETAHTRARMMHTSMRAAQHRLLARATSTDRAVEGASNRQLDGVVPAPGEDAETTSWTAWIAKRPEGR
jgi:hypothetical protein